MFYNRLETIDNIRVEKTHIGPVYTGVKRIFIGWVNAKVKMVDIGPFYIRIEICTASA